jgi:hypothetical protein
MIAVGSGDPDAPKKTVGADIIRPHKKELKL